MSAFGSSAPASPDQPRQLATARTADMDTILFIFSCDDMYFIELAPYYYAS
jgi:hypothetical protein